MNNSCINISLLSDSPCLNKDILLEVIPLAPLSMVNELPGSFYKTMKYPSKKMLCGLFENMLGWHFGEDVRKQIYKHLGKDEKKYKQGSTYLPLLMDYFEVKGKTKIHSVENEQMSFTFYSDLWSQARRRHKEYPQFNGARHISPNLFEELRGGIKENVSSSETLNNIINKCLKDNWQKLPFYYYSQAVREYVDLRAGMSIPIKIDGTLLLLLKKDIDESVTYLGNSEGWVDVKIKEI